MGGSRGLGGGLASGGSYVKPPKKGISKKALGLGIGAGFLGGAALGVAGTAMTMGAYHRWGRLATLLQV